MNKWSVPTGKLMCRLRQWVKGVSSYGEKEFAALLRPKDEISVKFLFRLFQLALLAAASVFVVNLVLFPLVDDLGAWGDFFGGVLNPVLTFFTFMGLLITIVLQQTELKETRRELERSANALELQITSVTRQNFESTFFQMLTLHNTIVNSISVYEREATYSIVEPAPTKDTETKGRACFDTFLDNFARDYRQASGATERERLQHAYDEFWSYRQQDLAHYYRYLYNVLRFVHESEGVENKLRYVKLLRAQLSDYELAMLFYTALNKHGINYWRYIHEYQLLDNMPDSIFLDPSHKKLFSPQSFGEPKRPPPVQWPPAALAAEDDARKAASSVVTDAFDVSIASPSPSLNI